MKIKEILKNKWGWAGAVLGLISCSNDIVKYLSPKLVHTIHYWYLSVPLGFILGLILEKIYRRLK